MPLRKTPDGRDEPGVACGKNSGVRKENSPEARDETTLAKELKAFLDLLESDDGVDVTFQVEFPFAGMTLTNEEGNEGDDE